MTGAETTRGRPTVLGITSTILLALGFLAMNLAWSITDPTALDANIGAGGLILLGRLTGSIGLILVVLDLVLHLRGRASRPVPEGQNS